MPIKEQPKIVIKRGVSVIEILCGVVIIFFAFFGAVSAYQKKVQDSISQQYAARAFELSQARLNDIVSDKGTKGYRHINNLSYPEIETLSGKDVGFVRRIDIFEVKGSDLVTAQVGSDYKRIVVSTSWGVNPDQNVSVSSLVTNH